LRERGSGTKGARTEQGNSKEKEGRAKAPSQYINGAEAIKAYRMAKEGRRSEGGWWPRWREVAREPDKKMLKLVGG
jgi:hypothetical protein